MSRAVLFDLDGTLTDSSQGIFRCFRHAFARLAQSGGPAVTLPGDDVLRDIVGPPLRQSFARYGGAVDVELMMRFYRERYETVARLFVATSKTESDAVRILHHFSLSQRFESINGARADGSRSAKREIIGETLAAHGVAADAATMIGDRIYDIEGARALGVRAIGALWGYGSAEELKDADVLAATPQEAAEAALTR
jgi:phosphoglycolate phosphatase